MPNKMIYPGTFDPITFGHIDIIERATHLCDQLIVAISTSSKKEPMFSLSERKKLAIAALRHLRNVQVVTFSGLLVDLAARESCMSILRGLRAVSDFEYEFQLAGMNRMLEAKLETIFLPASDKHAYISASMVREIASLGGDVSQFVPEVVCAALVKR